MKTEKPKLLIVDDEERAWKVLKINFQDRYDVLVAKNGAEAVKVLDKERVDAVLTDVKMPEMSGIELLKHVRKNSDWIPVVVMTAFGSVENAVEAMKAGAYDYILKPIKVEDAELVVKRAVEYSSMLKENRSLKDRLKEYEVPQDIITINPEMRSLIGLVKEVAVTDASVLIEGESGTGKELFARALHRMSARSEGPFIEVNCGAIPHELFESELFGHERGAFTGAVNTKKGKLELAEGGTIFLDEIGEMPLDLQVKLLHVLENRQFTRVGGTNFLQSAARVVAATNRNLKDDVESGRFRKDLYYRLKVVYLHVPPLRERKEDIPLLVQHFIAKHGDTAKKSITGIDPDAVETLRRHSWSGNVRELENVVLQSMIFARGGQITIDSLPAEIRESVGPLTENVPATKEELQKEKVRRTEKVLMDLERQFLLNLIEKSGGNISEAARTSGYDRRQIQNLIKKHGLDVSRLRDG
ncbi:MAG: sigma-54 dependent transcriptional regulator [Bacteroidetes bacterium]|nr:sigma-54 dependent transcriptional regulator [Bacteroidota bacterium]